MARYLEVIDLPVSIEVAFDYLADFATTAEWDPGVVEAQRLSRGAVGVGHRFRVVASTLGVKTPMVYTITEFERPHRVVLEGGSDSLRSIDEISFSPRGFGTRVTYEARLELSGIRQLADPVLQLMFQQIGQAAVAGMRKTFESMRGRQRGQSGPRGQSAHPA